ncbi:MAG: bifunctional folylpolyglutamate synthase/dihydrofolate synthase [Bacillota bacterium]
MISHEFLQTLDKFGTKEGFKPGLERINALLEYFNHPEKKLDFIHVGGSNGKGSTIAILESIYRQAGYKVGTFISPPLEEFNERIVVNRERISDEEVGKLIDKIRPAVKQVENSELGKPTFFEVVTLLAFLYFAECGPDIVLLEVGLGGRLDSTNVITSPRATIITSISLEHTAILGDTLPEIAREKAGIIKPGCPVVDAVDDCEAREVIARQAREKNSKHISVDDKYVYRIEESSLSGQKLSVSSQEKEYSIELGLAGEHQARNALLALAVVEELDTEFPVTEENLLSGMKDAYWPGRLEVIKNSPLVVLDGAHNPAAVGSLVKILQKEAVAYQKIYVVISILKDKDIKNMLNKFVSLSGPVKLVITKNNNFRAEEPENIKKIARQLKLKSEIIPDLKDAVFQTIEKCSSQDLVCITGSLSTVAEARKYFFNNFS